MSPKTVTVRPATAADEAAWLEMRKVLWPGEEASLTEEVRKYFSGSLREPIEVLLALDDSGRAIGFAELNIRPYAEGCYSGRVAYLEGWFVAADARRQGVGTALMRAAEDWGRARGCTEFGSDAVLDNEVSALAHEALGFAEVELLRCFRKDL
jgi:aminoglycoside 6'-N-acetyltransferase I